MIDFLCVYVSNESVRLPGCPPLQVEVKRQSPVPTADDLNKIADSTDVIYLFERFVRCVSNDTGECNARPAMCAVCQHKKSAQEQQPKPRQQRVLVPCEVAAPVGVHKQHSNSCRDASDTRQQQPVRGQQHKRSGECAAIVSQLLGWVWAEPGGGTIQALHRFFIRQMGRDWARARGVG
jgi:hypothetical protein